MIKINSSKEMPGKKVKKTVHTKFLGATPGDNSDLWVPKGTGTRCPKGSRRPTAYTKRSKKGSSGKYCVTSCGDWNPARKSGGKKGACLTPWMEELRAFWKDSNKGKTKDSAGYVSYKDAMKLLSQKKTPGKWKTTGVDGVRKD